MTTVIHGKKFAGTPFSIETEKVQNDPGIWDSTKVSVFKNNVLIGEYLRNYRNEDPPFYPFMVNGEWFALYSADYTCTSVMKLNEDNIVEWCSEPASRFGFCPVEFYVPRYHKYKTGDQIYFKTDSDFYETQEEFENDVVGSIESGYFNFGFLSGCVWGDDSSWKIRYINLLEIPNKKLVIEEKFGYFEMLDNCNLRETVNLDDWAEDRQIIKLLTTTAFEIFY